MSTTGTAYDVAVIGAGAVGLAAAWRAGAAGLKVVAIEQGTLFHAKGGSGAAERQWRYQYSDVESATLVLAAAESWRRLESAVDRRLIHPTGSLWFGDVGHDTNEGQIIAAAATLETLDLPFEWLDAPTIEKRYGFHALDHKYEGFYQPDGGVIDVRGTLWALFDLARATGHVEVLENTSVQAIEPSGHGIQIRTSRGTIAAVSCVIAAGAHTAGLLRPLGVRTENKIFEMPSAYFRVRDDNIDYPTWFAFEPPTDTEPGLYYGFGRNPWGARGLVRVAPDSEAYLLGSPEEATGIPRAEEMRRLSVWVARHLPDLDPEPIDASTCLVSLPEEHDRTFHLGRVPGADRIIYCASGWIYKFVPLLGEICLSLAEGDGLPDHLAPLVKAQV
jgi:sarcosine oxidase